MSPRKKISSKQKKIVQLDKELAEIEIKSFPPVKVDEKIKSVVDEQIARVEAGEPLRKVLGNAGRTKRKFVGAGRGNPNPHGTHGYRVKKGVVVEDRVKYEQAKERYDAFMKRVNNPKKVQVNV